MKPKSQISRLTLLLPLLLAGLSSCDIVLDFGGRGSNTAGGSGTSSDPYLIETAEQFAGLSGYLNRSGIHFKQTKDIDFASKNASSIGNLEKPFKHHYDGGGFALKNFACASEATDETPGYEDFCQGLFGFAEGATFTNINVQNASVSGLYNSGGILGKGRNCSFENILVSGTVSASQENAGMILGRGEDCTFSRCSSSGTLNAFRNGGGIVGEISGSIHFVECSSSAHVVSDSDTRNFMAGYIGGLAGSVTGGAEKNDGFLRCYATGDVEEKVKGLGSGFAGGLIGFMTSNVPVVDCYASGNVLGKGVWSTAYDKSSYYGGLWWRYRNACGSLIGIINTMTEMEIRNCYSSGTVTNDLACDQDDGFGLYCKGALVGLIYDTTTEKCIKDPYQGPSAVVWDESLAPYCIDIAEDMIEGFPVTLEHNYSVSEWRETYTPINYILTNHLMYKSLPTRKVTTNIDASKLADQTTFEGFDFSSTWVMNEGNPTLRWAI